MFGKEFWQTMDLKKLTIPEEILLSKESIKICDGNKIVNDLKIFYREALPTSDDQPTAISVLLLHGKMFSSKTWLDLGTIHILAAMGFRTVAVDIPIHACDPQIATQDRVTFLQNVIQAFSLSHPVIVSPSMSGFLSLPYLLKHWKSLAGYIPVAPVGFEVLEELPANKDLGIKKQVYAPLQEFLFDPIPDLSHIQTPTMIVFGEKDRSRSSALLSLLPVSQCQEIPNGRHPAYLDNPNLWHQLLYNFLKAVEETYCLEV